MTARPQIAAGHATLAAESVGSGDPVVFLHANIADRRMWAAQIAAVSDAGYKAIAYDRRGFGETRAETEPHSAVADLMTVLDALADGKPAVLVGCSQGGRIASDATLRYPERVRGLVLVDATITGAPEPTPPPELQELLVQQKEAVASGDVERIKAVKARIWLDGALGAEGRVTGEVRRLFMNMNDIILRATAPGSDSDLMPDAFQRLGQIAVPVLTLWGTLDFPHIQERCRQAAMLVPNGVGYEIADAAHLPSLEQPAAMTVRLQEFLASL